MYYYVWLLPNLDMHRVCGTGSGVLLKDALSKGTGGINTLKANREFQE